MKLSTIFLFIALACVILLVDQHVFTYTPTVPVSIGGNLAAYKYWHPNVFIDCTKQSYFSVVNSYDANGWPIATGFTHSFGVLRRGNLANGVYTIQIDGKVTVSAYATTYTGSHDAGQLLNQTFSSQTNKTTAYFDLFSNSTNMYVRYTQEKLAAFKNFKVIKPGYTVEDATNQIFTNEFLNDISGLKMLRFMDWGQTNFNPTTSWSERPLTTNATWCYSTYAIPFEMMIALANKSKKDMYLNIPAMADDDFILQLAKLVYSQLDKNLNVYLEYSNELWNYGFSQYVYSAKQAKAMVANYLPNLSPINLDGSQDTYSWYYRKAFHKTIEIVQVFASVFGKKQINKRIRGVYNCQAVSPGAIKPTLRYFFDYYGKMNQYMYAFAIAPYISIPNENRTLTTEQALDLFRDGVKSSAASYLQWLGYSRFYGVKLMAYEGGYGFDVASLTFNAERCMGSDGYQSVFNGNSYGWIMDKTDKPGARKLAIDKMVALGNYPLNTTLFSSVPDFVNENQTSLTVSLAKNIFYPQTSLNFVPSYQFYTENTTISYPIIITKRGLYNFSVETKANNPYMYFNAYLDDNWAGRYEARVSATAFNTTIITYDQVIEEGFLLFTVIPELPLRSMDFRNLTITFVVEVPSAESSDSSDEPDAEESIVALISPKYSTSSKNVTQYTSRNVVENGGLKWRCNILIISVAVLLFFILH